MPTFVDWMHEVGPRLDEALKPTPSEDSQSCTGRVTDARRQLHIIRDIDDRWRANVMGGRDRYDSAVSQRLLDRYRHWLATARPLADEVEAIGCGSGTPADQFRADIEDVEDLVEQRELRGAGQAAMARFHREDQEGD